MNSQTQGEKRGRRKDAGKREAILNAARVAFLDKGFVGTSMDALAAAAQVSKATLYSHFEDKTALYRAIIESKVEDYQLEDFAEHLCGDLETDLRHIALSLQNLIYDAQALEMMRMVIAETRENSDVPALFADTGPRRVLGQIADYFTAQKQRGISCLGDSAEDAELFSSLVVGHSPMMFALTGVEAPLNAAARKNRATRAVAQFLKLKRD